MAQWKHATKTKPRRVWGHSTRLRFKRLSFELGLAAAGGRSFNFIFAIVRIHEVYYEKLCDFPEGDVVLEGGRPGESPLDFIRRQKPLRTLSLLEEVSVVVFSLYKAL